MSPSDTEKNKKIQKKLISANNDKNARMLSQTEDLFMLTE